MAERHIGALVIGLALISMAVAPGTARAQSAVWLPQGATSGNIYYNGGNVGIGTPSPTSPLTVVGNGVSAWGTANFFRSDLGGNYSHIHFGSSGDWYIRSSRGSGKVILQDTGGNVGIGTTSPQHTLHVAGTIGAEEVIVSSTGADYVFKPNYRLAPLAEVAAYVHEHHHLPDVPSESEVKEKGVSLGEMQSKLLAKIEELTLHMIRTEQENHELRERIMRLELIGKGEAK